MALTMTRTRTQTALTRLAEAVAAVHGELAALECLLETLPESASALQTRRQALLADRAALHLTLRQFDDALDAQRIGASGAWLRARPGRGVRQRLAAYLQALGAHPAGARTFERALARLRPALGR